MLDRVTFPAASVLRVTPATAAKVMVVLVVLVVTSDRSRYILRITVHVGLDHTGDPHGHCLSLIHI